MITRIRLASGKGLSGIDIGSGSIKIIKLSRKGKRVCLDEIGYIRLSEEIKLLEEGDKLSKGISDLIKTKEMGVEKVASALSSPSLTIRYIILPRMPKKDLYQAVKWEVRKQITFSAEELVCDYSVLEEVIREGEKKLSIVAFAVKKSDVQEHLNILREASLIPVVIDTIPTALLSAFDHNNLWEQGVNYAMVDIGKTKTNLVILRDRMLRFAREIPFGGGDLTTSLQNNLGLSLKEAETRKIDHGMLLKEENDRTVPEKTKRTRDILTPVLEQLALELHRSFDYYKVQFREGSISKIFLTGGSAKLKGIDRFLSESLDIPCFIDDPLKNIDVDMKGIEIDEISSLSPMLTVATGLALRRTGK